MSLLISETFSYPLCFISWYVNLSFWSWVVSTSTISAITGEANKECTSASLEVSNEGLARIRFKVDEYDSLYHIVKSSSV